MLEVWCELSVVGHAAVFLLFHALPLSHVAHGGYCLSELCAFSPQLLSMLGVLEQARVVHGIRLGPYKFCTPDHHTLALVVKMPAGCQRPAHISGYMLGSDEPVSIVSIIPPIGSNNQRLYMLRCLDDGPGFQHGMTIKVHVYGYHCVSFPLDQVVPVLRQFQSCIASDTACCNIWSSCACLGWLTCATYSTKEFLLCYFLSMQALLQTHRRSWATVSEQLATSMAG